MNNLVFLNDENIPMVTHNGEDRKSDIDDYNASNTSRVDETKYAVPGSTDKQATPNVRLWQKVKRDKLAALYRDSNVTCNLDLTNPDKFNCTKNTKKGTTVFEFYNSDKL